VIVKFSLNVRRHFEDVISAVRRCQVLADADSWSFVANSVAPASANTF